MKFFGLNHDVLSSDASTSIITWFRRHVVASRLARSIMVTMNGVSSWLINMVNVVASARREDDVAAEGGRAWVRGGCGLERVTSGTRRSTKLSVSALSVSGSVPPSQPNFIGLDTSEQPDQTFIKFRCREKFGEFCEPCQEEILRRQSRAKLDRLKQARENL